jgi:hypothetical protein
MRKFIKVVSLAVAIGVSALAADVTFTWTKNPASELVSSYAIEYTKVPGVTNWTHLTSVPGTTNTAIVKGIQPGFKYQFRAFAVNGVGKGTNLSNIILIPTNAPSAVVDFNGNVQ